MDILYVRIQWDSSKMSLNDRNCRSFDFACCVHLWEPLRSWSTHSLIFYFIHLINVRLHQHFACKVSHSCRLLLAAVMNNLNHSLIWWFTNRSRLLRMFVFSVHIHIKRKKAGSTNVKTAIAGIFIYNMVGIVLPVCQNNTGALKTPSWWSYFTLNNCYSMTTWHLHQSGLTADRWSE